MLNLDMLHIRADLAPRPKL
jgi:uncharacterized membrane protein YoaK (UPF0700 family)